MHTKAIIFITALYFILFVIAAPLKTQKTEDQTGSTGSLESPDAPDDSARTSDRLPKAGDSDELNSLPSESSQSGSEPLPVSGKDRGSSLLHGLPVVGSLTGGITHGLPLSGLPVVNGF